MDAVQFTVHDIGSAWTFTRVTHRLRHRGREITVTVDTPMVNRKPKKR